ncbi:MAG: hypothetical protein ACT6Q3_16770 [Sphingopyxis sp.]
MTSVSSIDWIQATQAVASVVGILLAPSVFGALYGWITSRIKVTFVKYDVNPLFEDYKWTVEIISKREIFQNRVLHFYTKNPKSKIVKVRTLDSGSSARFSIVSDDVGGFDVVFSRFPKGRRVRLEVIPNGVTDINVSSDGWKILKNRVVYRSSNIFGRKAIFGKTIVTVVVGDHRDRLLLMLWMFFLAIIFISARIIYYSAEYLFN